jgi:opacity protein-like surface antigen
MHPFLITVTFLLASLVPFGAGAATAETVEVQDPYIDLHSGPGRGFPVTQVVERGASVVLLRQRTDWVKVRTERDREGWVNRKQLERTLTADGAEVRLAGPGPDARVEHRWEVGVGAGDFDGADTVAVTGSYALTESLFVRADVSQLLGEYSTGWLGTAGIGHIFMPQWRVSPFASIGGGVVHVEPNATLVQTSDRTNTAAYAGAGLRGFLSDRFLLQAEYRQFVIFMDTNDNEVINEWTVGFTHFF